MKHQTYKNVTIMDHPLIIHKISKMRDVATSSKEFREYVNEIAMLMGYEVTRDLPLMEKSRPSAGNRQQIQKYIKMVFSARPEDGPHWRMIIGG